MIRLLKTLSKYHHMISFQTGWSTRYDSIHKRSILKTGGRWVPICIQEPCQLSSGTRYSYSQPRTAVGLRATRWWCHFEANGQMVWVRFVLMLLVEGEGTACFACKYCTIDSFKTAVFHLLPRGGCPPTHQPSQQKYDTHTHVPATVVGIGRHNHLKPALVI